MTGNEIIFIIGPQGSGKGTQGKILAKKYGFFYWDMGAILREYKTKGTPLAEKVRVIDQGVLLTDDVLLEVVKEKISLLPQEKGIIFDGVPRRLGQAEFLIEYLKIHGWKNFFSVYVHIPEEETLKRLLLRAQTEGRVDDTEEKIRFRLKQYKEDTVPVLDFLKAHTKFLQINGLGAVSEVNQTIEQQLHA